MGRHQQSLIRLMMLLAVIVGGMALALGTEQGRHHLSLARIRDRVQSYQPYDRLAFVIIFVLAAPFVPATAMSFVGSLLYGTIQGTLLVWISATLGSIAPFAWARWLGRPGVASLMSSFEALSRFDRFIGKHGLRGLFYVRLLPIFPYILVNYGCGLASVRWRDYLLATFLGLLPGVFFYQYLFASFGEAILMEGVSWRHLRDPNILLSASGFLIFAWGGQVLSHRLRGENDSAEPIDNSDGQIKS
jgi:uncharacterized membrane protein YdjX (TVP38/TMEM64 family)